MNFKEELEPVYESDTIKIDKLQFYNHIEYKVYGENICSLKNNLLSLTIATNYANKHSTKKSIFTE